MPGAFAQGSKRQSAYDAVQEKDKDRPDLRDRWMMRGRTAPAGQSPAALRLRAHQQKMAMRAAVARAQAAASPGTAPGAPWLALGPTPLLTDQDYYGAVSGRVTAVAIDPSDATGNTVYVAGASGGVWKSSNAAAVPATGVTWTPLTDQQASLVNGAVSVKPDGSVVLVGTGEPNSASDSYYGVGILRSTDHGNTWTLIPTATGNNPALSFAGLGFAKFAWNAATVVTATGTTAKGFGEGDITPNTNRGLYLSTDNGVTWIYQTPMDGGTAISPISATDVVYDSVAGKFIASLRYHGLYTSTNGTNWTRMANQPAPLSPANCPPVASSTCPIYRGQLAVVPGRDEVYFWFVSIDQFNNVIDQGIWRSISGAAWVRIDETGLTSCGDPGNNGCGAEQGYYNLEIAAVPDGQATDLYAGAVNLFKCQLINSRTTCLTLDPALPNQWLNLTHVYGCSSIASVHPDEHGLDFMSVGGSVIMYFGNDGGIYRTLDGFMQLNSGSCGIANGFDDLNASTVPNGTIGSMTQFVSFAIHPTDQETMVGGTQDNGSPGTSSAIGTAVWTTVNGGDGGYSAINAVPGWPPIEWYTSNPFVNIYMCPYGVDCTTNTFSLTVGSGEVGGDVGAFYTPYILDPQDPYEMLVGTCRVWRGAPTVPPSSFTALSVDFDTGGSNTCTGEEINLVSGLDAGGPTANFLSTTVYATTEGTGPNATSPSGGEVWVTANAGITPMVQVTGSINPMHYTISSVAMDRSDLTGATAYVGIMGFNVSHVFKSANAGASWTDWSGSGNTALPSAPVNALLVDGTTSTIYAGTDVGVFMSSTTNASWTEVGPQPGATGYLPNVPVSAIRMFNYGGTKKLRVSTYGRGIWEYPLAIAPDYANVISNTPLTVVANQTATFNGVLIALAGYGSPVNLSCSANAPPTCQLSQTQVTPTVAGTPYTLQAAGPAGDYVFNVHAAGTDSQRIPHDAAMTLHVLDFNLTAPNPNALTVPQGQVSNASTVQISASGSFSETVALSCPSGLPLGAACVFSPSSMVNPTAGNPVTVTLTVTAASNTPLGGPTTVTLAATVEGTSAAKTKTFTLTVISPGPDFSLAVAATPSSSVVDQSVTWNGALTAWHGYNQSVSLVCAGAAPATCTVTPSSLVPTSSGAPFTVTVGSATQGSFSFSIQGTDGTFTHSQAVGLTVGTDVAWNDTGGTSATIEAGDTATFSFSAAPVGGGTFSGAVSFACVNLPRLSSCTFSPPSIDAGAGITPVTLTIATTGPYGGNARRKGSKSGNKPGPAGAADPPGFGLALVGLLTIPLAGIWLSAMEGRSRYQRGLIARGWPLLLWLLLLVACGGLKGGNGGGPPPPAQATVTVTPGSGNLYEDPPGNTWPDTDTHLQFSATVNNGSSQAVTWAVTGGQANGTIDANGLYAAPPIAPNPASVTVTATSTLAPLPGSATVNIQSATAVGTSNVEVTATAAGGTGHAVVVALTVD